MMLNREAARFDYSGYIAAQTITEVAICIVDGCDHARGTYTACDCHVADSIQSEAEALLAQAAELRSRGCDRLPSEQVLQQEIPRERWPTRMSGLSPYSSFK